MQDRITIDGRFLSSALPAPEQAVQAGPVAGVPSTAPQVPPMRREVRLPRVERHASARNTREYRPP